MQKKIEAPSHSTKCFAKLVIKAVFFSNGNKFWTWKLDNFEIYGIENLRTLIFGYSIKIKINFSDKFIRIKNLMQFFNDSVLNNFQYFLLLALSFARSMRSPFDFCNELIFFMVTSLVLRKALRTGGPLCWFSSAYSSSISPAWLNLSGLVFEVPVWCKPSHQRREKNRWFSIFYKLVIYLDVSESEKFRYK